MQRVLLIVSLLAGFVCTYDLLNDLNDCAHVRGFYDYYNGPTTTYNLGFNVDEYSIKELTIGTEYRNRFFPSNRRESSSVSFSPRVLDKLDYQFTYVNDTRICYRIEFDCYNTGCPNAVYEILCQPMPTWKSPVYPYTGCYPSDLNGGCFQLDWGTCQELYVTTLFETVVTKPARVINGFRLSDCNGVVLSPNSTDWITVQEGTVDLAVPETKQQLVPVNNTNIFIQLMISVCPRTAVAINDLISSLNSFVKAVDLRTTYIALTVFDGAPDYVDLLYFSNNSTLINSTIANLKNYVLRDDTCNVRQSVAKKFSEVSSYIYGQPWDTLNFVIYTATGDLVNYIPDDATVTIPINRRADVSTYLIGQNLPTSQDALFRALGVRGRFNTQDGATSTQAFTDVARSIRAVSSGFTLFGYCSASRVGQISAKLKMNYLGLSDHPTARIMDLSYNASDFTPGCTAAHARDFCSPCSTVIDHHHIMCFECFNQSSVALSNDTDFAQVLLRAPVNGRNILYLPVPSSGAQFNVYIRFGGVSNPLLYDYKFLAVSQQTVELPNASKGALLGVYIDWNGYDYDASLGIRIEGPYTPPVTPPVAAPVRPPIAAPVTPPVTPPVTSPFAQVPTTAPIPQYDVPVSYPAPIVAEGPIAAPVPQYETPVDYSIPLTVVPPVPQYDVPVSNEPYPGSDAPVNSPTQDYNPTSQVPVDYSYPVAQVPLDSSPVPVQTGSGPVGQESPVATPQSATDAGTVADKNSDVSSGVVVQSGLALVFALLYVAF